MKKVIYCTDAHIGRDFKNGVTICEGESYIHGTQALETLEHLFRYATEHGIEEIYHGGDLISDNARVKIGEYNTNKSLVKNLIKSFGLKFQNASGNHDEKLSSPLPVNSIHSPLPNTSMIIIHMKHSYFVGTVNGRYHYDAIATEKLLDEHIASGRSNLIIKRHTKFLPPQTPCRNEMTMLRPPKNTSIVRDFVTDNAVAIVQKLQKVSANDRRNVLTLHGHEHRFDKTKIDYDSIIMPALSQLDIDNINRPCGLFMEISTDPETGELSYEYKKLVGKRRAITVPESYMLRQTENVRNFNFGKKKATTPRQHAALQP